MLKADLSLTTPNSTSGNPEILYEDNHLLIVNKRVGEIVQGDKTGDKPLSDILSDYIAQRDSKPGRAYIGVTHRLDRPVSGVTIFTKTSKALERMNELFRSGGVSKKYWAIIAGAPADESGELIHYLKKNEEKNRSYAYNYPKVGAKEARLKYRLLTKGERYSLLEVELLTGRHHQIRCQLAEIGYVIKGDLKYGAPRSNRDGGISLLARNIRFIHPVSKIEIDVTAPVPDETLWKFFEQSLK